MNTDESATLAARLFVAMQYVLPQHAISRIVLAATRSRATRFKNFLITRFVAGFKPDMSDAVEPNPTAYASFNEFFTRALKPGARPIDEATNLLACPVDGTVSQAGPIKSGAILQAKGHSYDVDTLLAGQQDWAARFRDGAFATIYLAPYNYHRIHMPIDGTLRAAWYVPGRLFSVNQTTAAAVPGLFARNERVVCCFETNGMPWALVLVGALNVGSMTTVWHGDVTPRRPRRVTALPVSELSASASLAKGAEMGRFNMGSTVVLVFPQGATTWDKRLVAGQIVRMGENIGVLHAAG